jgi:hypothetical protein
MCNDSSEYPVIFFPPGLKTYGRNNIRADLNFYRPIQN